MHSFITILTVATAALTAALPHANVHYKLHPVRRDLQAGRLTLAGRDVPTTYNLSPIGTCGSTTGYQCSPGMCCSQWGYCGTGPAYCGGAGGSNSTSPTGGTAVPAYSSAPSSAAAAGSAAPAGSSAPSSAASAASSPASAATSAVVSPVGKGPAPSHHHHKKPHSASSPAGAPSAYSSPAGAPSAYSSAGGSAPPAYTSSAKSAPAATSPATSAPAPTSAPAGSTTSAPSAPASYSSPAPASSSSPSSGGSGGGSGANTYKMYNGDGSSSAGWPAESAWADFDSLWEANLPTISISCAQFGQIENSDSENDDLKSAISSVGAQYSVDERFILAIIMQESKGCVRVDTTVGSVKNPGLMQSHDGSGTCYGAAAGACSSSEITQMVTDGTHGTSSGDGLQQLLAQCSSASGSQKYYEAARMYNSGSIAPGGDLGQGVATHCYAADIANRLTGWTTATCTCTLD